MNIYYVSSVYNRHQTANELRNREITMCRNRPEIMMTWNGNNKHQNRIGIGRSPRPATGGVTQSEWNKLYTLPRTRARAWFWYQFTSQKDTTINEARAILCHQRRQSVIGLLLLIYRFTLSLRSVQRRTTTTANTINKWGVGERGENWSIRIYKQIDFATIFGCRIDDDVAISKLT